MFVFVCVYVYAGQVAVDCITVGVGLRCSWVLLWLTTPNTSNNDIVLCISIQ